MKNLLSVLKWLVNIILLSLYSIISITIVNWIYGLVVSKLMDGSVPWSADPVHLKMAVIVFVVVLIVTLLARKFFYFRIFWEENEIENKEIKKKIVESEKLLEEKKKEIEKEVEEMKIYIDKEIK